MSRNAWVERNFPRLRDSSEYEHRSPVDHDYNCVAFAAGDTDRWWWPPAPGRLGGGSYWPPGVATDLSVASFLAAFESLGYEQCSDGAAEDGVEKIAIYAKDGSPTHAARQEPSSGAWLSKLGRGVDIAHASAEGVGGSDYGEIVAFMRRSGQDD